MSDKKLSRVYYSLRGYWKGITAIKKLASATKVDEDFARAWLMKQAILADLFAHAALHSKTEV